MPDRNHPIPATPADLLGAVLAADPSRPLVTYYDDATGERIELSAKVFANWVAKTANLLVDGLDAQPGERVVLCLPPHWQTAVWMLACWSAGLVAVPLADPAEAAGSGADLVVVSEDMLTALSAGGGARDVVGLSLHALGGPLRERPAGVVDYAAEVRTYGDDYVPYEPVDPDRPALTVMNNTFTGSDLVRLGREAAQRWGLDAHSRVLTTLPFTTLDGLLTDVIGPLSANASVIIQRNLDKDVLDRRISLEHVTAVAGVPGWNDRTGDVRRLV